MTFEEAKVGAPAVVYAAKSTADPRGSIETQLTDSRDRAEAEGRRVIATHRDERVSAYKTNRGPGLESAVADSIAAARIHGEAELWVQHSDRLARGSGRKTEARHLGKLYFDLQAEGVQLRSVQDDDNLRDAIRAVLIGERNYEDSRRKGLAVAAGRRRTRERGYWTGGPIPEGYRKIPRREGEPRRLRLDGRAPIIRRIFQLGLGGMSAAEVARLLNAEGVPPLGRRRGRFWDGMWHPWRIRQIWSLSFYAGLIIHRGEVTGEAAEDAWPRLLKPSDWYRLRRVNERRAMEHSRRPTAGRGRRRVGRHLLAYLAECGLCGASIHSLTNPPLVNGVRTRRYQCSSSVDVTGGCAAPRLDAEQVERPFRRGFGALAVDLSAWITRRAKQLDDQVDHVEGLIESDEDRLTALGSERKGVELDYRTQVAAGSAGAARVAASALDAIEDDRRELERRRVELRSALETLVEAVPACDEVLSLYLDLERGLACHLQGASASDLNARLREAVERVVLTPLDDGAVRVEAEVSTAFLATIETDGNALSQLNPIHDDPLPGPEAERFAMDLEAPPPLRPIRVHRARIAARTSPTTMPRKQVS